MFFKKFCKNLENCYLYNYVKLYQISAHTCIYNNLFCNDQKCLENLFLSFFSRIDFVFLLLFLIRKTFEICVDCFNQTLVKKSVGRNRKCQKSKLENIATNHISSKILRHQRNQYSIDNISRLV